jgi:hypothetical protein
MFRARFLSLFAKRRRILMEQQTQALAAATSASESGYEAMLEHWREYIASGEGVIVDLDDVLPVRPPRFAVFLAFVVALVGIGIGLGIAFGLTIGEGAGVSIPLGIGFLCSCSGLALLASGYEDRREMISALESASGTREGVPSEPELRDALGEVLDRSGAHEAAARVVSGTSRT